MYLPNKHGLLLPQFAETTSTKPVMEEIATTADGRDITLGYVDNLPLLPSTDPLLKARGTDFRIYEQARSDDQVQAALQQRKLALSGKEWTVTAGGKRAVDKAAADFIKEHLERLPFDRLTEKMLSGLFWGYAVSECIWSTDGRFIVPETIKVKKQRRFGFAPDGTLRLLTSQHQLGEALPDRKFWAYSTGGDDDDDLYGLGLAHWLYWPVFFKRNGVKFWLVFLEKFGMPTAVGKYPSGASKDEKKRLLEALQAIQSDSGIRIPETMQIELLEAARSGSADYLSLYSAMNAAISKVILGHSATTDSTAGKLGGDNMAQEVRADLTAADGDLICSSFNLSVVKWLVEWNFNGAALPRVYRDVKPQNDLKTLAERDKIIFDMGYKPTLQYISSTYSVDVTETSTPPPASNANTDNQTTFAEPTQTTNIDTTPIADYARQLEQLTADEFENWLQIIKQRMSTVSDLNAWQEELLNMYGHLPIDEIVNRMTLAYACADLAGQFEIISETNEDK